MPVNPTSHRSVGIKLRQRLALTNRQMDIPHGISSSEASANAQDNNQDKAFQDSHGAGGF